MISKALASEKDLIKQYWKRSFPDEREVADAYFDVYFDENETITLREGDEIIALAQVKSKVIHLANKNLKTLYITHIMTRPEYQGQGYMSLLIESINEWAEKEHIITVLKPFEPSVYRSFGFENVISISEYTIASKYIPNINIKGIILSPKIEDLVKTYQSFTAHFDGYFIRDEKYFKDLIMYLGKRKGHVIGLKENNEMVGYCAYIQHASHVEVLECTYDTSGTLVKLLSFISRGKHRVMLKATTSEKIHKLFPHATKTEQPFLMARINDKELFERLYGLKILSAYSGFNVSAKPLFNRDFQ